MTNTPAEARKALQAMCVEGRAGSIENVKTLVRFINEVERMKLPQTPALFQPPRKPKCHKCSGSGFYCGDERAGSCSCQSKKRIEHSFLQPRNVGD